MKKLLLCIFTTFFFFFFFFFFAVNIAQANPYFNLQEEVVFATDHFTESAMELGSYALFGSTMNFPLTIMPTIGYIAAGKKLTPFTSKKLRTAALVSAIITYIATFDQFKYALETQGNRSLYHILSSSILSLASGALAKMYFKGAPKETENLENESSETSK